MKNAAVLLALSSMFGILPESTQADVGSLDCYGISDRWVSEANRIIHKAENVVNSEVDKYVSLANFDLGSTKFGIQGHASLGQLKTPRFDCANPKGILKSGMSDFNLTPAYLVKASIFNMPVTVVDARMVGAQGNKTNNTTANRQYKNIILSVKVLGVDVLHKIGKGPEVQARTVDELQALYQVPDPSALPGREKTGVGGKLIDISRSISDTLKVQPRLDIIPGVLYVAIDAGFYLQSTLIFTYGVDSVFFSAHGQRKIRSALDQNPLDAVDGYCDTPDVTADGSGSASALPSACELKSSQVEAKGLDFYKKLATGTNETFSRAQKLRDDLRKISLRELLGDANVVRASFGPDWDNVTADGKSLEERKALIDAIDMDQRMRPLKEPIEKLKAAGDTAKGVQSAASETYAQLQAILAATKSGLPEVRADAGVALTGRVGGWVAAVLAADLVVAKGWAGVKGYLTLIDIRAGIGASLSTKSRYIDLTATFEQIRMDGGLDLFYGVSVGVDPFMVKFEGSQPLYRYLGQVTRQKWLVGRFDFRAVDGDTNKPALFWCADIFGNSTLDPDRCSDGDLSKAELAPSLAAHQAMKINSLGEMIINENAGCIISDGGKPFFTSPDAAGCSSLLPNSPTELLTLSGTTDEHPLSRYYREHPESFMSNLRDAQNAPVKVFSANSITNGAAPSPTSVLYTGNLAVLPPIVSNDVLSFSNQMPYSVSAKDDPLSDRIFTLGSRAQYVQTGTADPVIGSSTDPNLMIKMDWVTQAGLWPAAWQIQSTQPKLYVGDLNALPNELLVVMGQTFRLGRCGIQASGTDLTLNVSGSPYPRSGDPEGKASLNLSEVDDPCFVGSATGLGSDPKVAYAACTLRRAIADEECFPPSRVVDLVRLANLSNQDALRYFLDPSHKLISGDIYPNGKTFSSNVTRTEIDSVDRCNSDSCHRDLLRTFFNGNNYGSGWAYPFVSDFNNANSGNDPFLRCQINYYGDQDDHGEEHWFNREWVSTTFGGHSVMRMVSKDSSTCFKVGASTASRAQSIGGDLNCFNNSFKADYQAPVTARELPIMCDINNPGNRNRVADTALNGTSGSNLRQQALAGNPDTSGTLSYDLAFSVKQCIARDHECVYTPDGGNSDAALIASSTCTMKIEKLTASGDGISSFPVPGPTGTASLNGCLQQSSNPNFSDAQMFCNDSSVQANLNSQSGTLTGTTAVSAVFKLTAAWDLRQLVNNVADSGNHQEREIGRCFLNRRAGSTVVEITGQTTDGGGRNLASVASGANCSLYVIKPASAGYASLIRSAPADASSAADPTSSVQNCSNALGFQGSASEIQAEADGYCTSLSSKDLVDIFSAQRTALTSKAPQLSDGTNVGTANLMYYISGGPFGMGAVQGKSCSVKHTPLEWAEILDSGGCTLKLSPYQYSSVVLSQTLKLPTPSGGSAGCATAVNNYLSCTTIRSLPIYIPFQTTGVTLEGFYGNGAIGSPSHLSCSSSPYAPNGDATTDTTCRLSGWMSIPSASYDSSSAEFIRSMKTTSANASSLTSASAANAATRCNTLWSSEVSQVSGGGSSSALFCMSALDSVNASLNNQKSQVLDCSTYGVCPQLSGFTWTTGGASSPLGGTLPVTMKFRSRYGGTFSSTPHGNSGSSTATPSPSDHLIATCRYQFNAQPNTTNQWVLVPEGLATPAPLETPLVKTCIRPNEPNPTPNTLACVTLTPGATLLFGGAGPQLLAQTSSNPQYFANSASTCSTYLPQMNAVSDLNQPDASKRLPMWVATVDAGGNVAVPKETDNATFYCQPAVCSFSAEYQGESHTIDLGFPQSFGIKPTSAGACEGMNKAAADSVCETYRSDAAMADNVSIDLYSVFGSDRRLVRACDPVVSRQCSLGLARNGTDDLYTLSEKPSGDTSILSLTGHSGVFGTANTIQSCGDYFSADPACSIPNPFDHDPAHPGEIYSVYRKFGATRTLQTSCYTAITLAAAPAADSSQNMTLSWSNTSAPAASTYEIQYCKNTGCDPAAQDQSDHFTDTFTAVQASNATRSISAASGITYGYRVRLTIPGASPAPSVTLPWSWTVYATASGLEQNVILSQQTPASDNTITLNWSDAKTSDHYELQSCSDVACTSTLPLPVGINTVAGVSPAPVSPIFRGAVKTATFDLLSGGQSYWFRIRSFAAATSTSAGWSPVVAVTTTGSVINSFGGGGGSGTPTVTLTGPTVIDQGTCEGPYLIQAGSSSGPVTKTIQISQASPGLVASVKGAPVPKILASRSSLIAQPVLIGLPTPTPASGPSFALAGQGSGHFYSDIACKNPIVAVTSSGDSTPVYFRDPAQQHLLLTATNVNFAAPATLPVSVGMGMNPTDLLPPNPAVLVKLSALCLSGQLSACRSYIESIPAGSARAEAEAALKALLIKDQSTLCGLFGILCGAPSNILTGFFGKKAADGALEFASDTKLHHATFLDRDVVQVSATSSAFAALKTNGSVITWGDPHAGGDSGAVAARLSSGVQKVYSNDHAFAALKTDGSVVTWGNPYFGGDSTLVNVQISSGVKNIVGSGVAFAALKLDGSVVTWGRDQGGGDSSAASAQLNGGVTAIYSNGTGAFAALKSNGVLVTWGDHYYGGDSSSVAAKLTSGVTSVFSNTSSFAALKADGSVVTWGNPTYGGDSSAAQNALSGGVVSISSTPYAYAALKADGSVAVWGQAPYGGDISAVAMSLSSGVKAIYATQAAFAALKSDGSVITWGNAQNGGDSSSVRANLSSGVKAIYHRADVFYAIKNDGSVVTWGGLDLGYAGVASSLSSGVVSIHVTTYAAAALKSDGSVVSWGYAHTGDASSVHAQLTGGVTDIITNRYAFVALKSGGSIVTWGDYDSGGGSSSTDAAVAGGVKAVYSTMNHTYAALKSDGSVVTWSADTSGDGPVDGGNPGRLPNSIFPSTIAPSVLRSITSITANYDSFAGLRSDGSVISWGTSSYNGGDSGAVSSKLAGGVVAVYASTYSFAALKADGSVITWGNSTLGGDSGSVSASLSSGVFEIYPGSLGFSALKADGSVVTWGYGALADSNPVKASLAKNVKAIYSNQGSYAALKSDGSVISWGNAYSGGDSTSVKSGLASGVTAVYSTDSSFAALKSDGSVITWGDPDSGGNSRSVQSSLTSGVTTIYKTSSSFAALKSNGSVVTWGANDNGGNSTAVKTSLSSEVKSIHSTNTAFVALKKDGTAVTWGSGCNVNSASHFKNVISSKQSIVLEGQAGEINPICGPAHSGYLNLNTSDYFLTTDGKNIYYLK